MNGYTWSYNFGYLSTDERLKGNDTTATIILVAKYQTGIWTVCNDWEVLKLFFNVIAYMCIQWQLQD